VIDRVRSWLGDVKKDIETPDLWAQLQGERNLLGGGLFQGAENTPFTLSEQEGIAKRLLELRDNAKDHYSLSEAQVLILDAKIDYLVGATGRLGRIDWREVLIGSLVGFMLSVAIPPEAAREILVTFLAGTAKFLGNAIQAWPAG